MQRLQVNDVAFPFRGRWLAAGQTDEDVPQTTGKRQTLRFRRRPHPSLTKNARIFRQIHLPWASRPHLADYLIRHGSAVPPSPKGEGKHTVLFSGRSMPLNRTLRVLGKALIVVVLW